MTAPSPAVAPGGGGHPGPSAFSEFHAELRAVCRQVLGAAGDLGPPELWARCADAGWAGLEVPSDLGGAGATFAEVAVVQQELGRAASSCPFTGAVALGVGALAMVEPAAARDELLSEVAAGRTRPAVVLPADDGPAPEAHASFTVEAAAGSFRLRGAQAVVLDAPGADRLLIPARYGRTEVLVAADPAAPGIAVRPLPVVDETRSLGTVEADASVPADAVWPCTGEQPGPWSALRRRGELAMAFDSQGIAEAMLEATVAYAGARRQFGRPIGSFQAVQHACADLLVKVSMGRELLARAVEGTGAGGGEGQVTASMAKAFVCASAVEVAGKALQLHGGIGYTWESGIHAYLKRAALNRSLFGAPSVHLRWIGRRYLRAEPAEAGAETEERNRVTE